MRYLPVVPVRISVIEDFKFTMEVISFAKHYNYKCVIKEKPDSFKGVPDRDHFPVYDEVFDRRLHSPEQCDMFLKFFKDAMPKKKFEPSAGKVFVFGTGGAESSNAKSFAELWVNHELGKMDLPEVFEEGGKLPVWYNAMPLPNICPKCKKELGGGIWQQMEHTSECEGGNTI